MHTNLILHKSLLYKQYLVRRGNTREEEYATLTEHITTVNANQWTHIMPWRPRIAHYRGVL